MRNLRPWFASLGDEIYFARVSLKRFFFGVEWSTREVSRCRRRHLARLLRQCGATVGERTNLKEGLQIDNAHGDADATGDFSNLRIGRKCYVGKGVFFDLPDRITLEDESVIGAGVKFITHEDCGDRMMSQWYPRSRAAIVIGRGSWIGVNAVILKGVVLGEGCVVAAGAVLTRSFPAYSVVAGVPARCVKELPPRRSDPTVAEA